MGRGNLIKSAPYGVYLVIARKQPEFLEIFGGVAGTPGDEIGNSEYRPSLTQKGLDLLRRQSSPRITLHTFTLSIVSYDANLSRLPLEYSVHFGYRLQGPKPGQALDISMLRALMLVG